MSTNWEREKWEWGSLRRKKGVRKKKSGGGASRGRSTRKSDKQLGSTQKKYLEYRTVVEIALRLGQRSEYKKGKRVTIYDGRET